MATVAGLVVLRAVAAQESGGSQSGPLAHLILKRGPMSDDQKLTDSEIAELRANHKERDHWKWLLRLLKQSALWTVAVVAGAHALIEKGGELWKWLQQR